MSRPKFNAVLLAAAASFVLSAGHAAGPLDGLEMDVLDVHETPARASSRITLPQISADDREFGARKQAQPEFTGRMGIQSTSTPEALDSAKSPAVASEAPAQAEADNTESGSAAADAPAAPASAPGDGPEETAPAAGSGDKPGEAAAEAPGNEPAVEAPAEAGDAEPPAPAEASEPAAGPAEPASPEPAAPAPATEG